MALQIILEIVFIARINVVQGSVNTTLDKYFINAILKAGGQEYLAKMDMTYEQFRALPNVTQSNYECNEDCMIHKTIMDDLQSEVS